MEKKLFLPFFIFFLVLLFYQNIPFIASLEIPMFYSIDENLVLPTIVSLTSLCENANKTTKYQIYLMQFGNFSEENTTKILSINSQYPNVCNMTLLNETIFTYFFKGVKLPNEDFGIGAAYARLITPEIFPEYDRMIYLDGGDTVVLEDLTEMYNLEINDNYLLGHNDYWGKEDDYKYINQTGKYINSGILLMNLKKLREDHVWEKFYSFITSVKYLHSPDQTTINHVCKGKVDYLPSRYGVFSRIATINQVAKSHIIGKYCISVNDCLEAFSNPAIIHFTGLGKPYHKDYNNHYTHYFWFYAKKSLFFDEIVKQYVEKCFYQKVFVFKEFWNKFKIIFIIIIIIILAAFIFGWFFGRKLFYSFWYKKKKKFIKLKGNDIF